MRRQPWRWPTSSADKATASSTGTTRASAFSSSKPFGPFRTAAQRLWAAISMPVFGAVTRPSPITPAATAIARSARQKRAIRGSSRVNENFSSTDYFHVVFTVPHELNVLALQNPREFYDLLFTASAQTLLEVAADPRHLGAEIGAISILHTWGKTSCCIRTSLRYPGGRSPRTTPAGSAPVILSFCRSRFSGRVFRGKFCAGLKRLYRRKRLRCAGPASVLAEPKQFNQLLRRLHRQDWVVYAKPAFGGPEKVLRYLGRYTHRIAISNHRLLAFDGQRVTLPLEGLCSWRQAAQNDAGRNRVPATFLPPCFAEGIRPNPPFRIPRQPIPQQPAQRCAVSCSQSVPS